MGTKNSEFKHYNIKCYCLTGVDTKFKGEFYEVLLSVSHVPELNKVEEEEEGLLVGAAVSLNTLKDKLSDMVNKLTGEWVPFNFHSGFVSKPSSNYVCLMNDGYVCFTIQSTRQGVSQLCLRC